MFAADMFTLFNLLNKLSLSTPMSTKELTKSTIQCPPTGNSSPLRIVKKSSELSIGSNCSYP